MSIWGKLVGGVAGFALGGPMGALLGAVAGHYYFDRLGAERAAAPAFDPEVAFTAAVVVLAAKMAKADGRVSRAEIEAFRRVFHIPAEEVAAVGRLFDEARREVRGFEPYARQIAVMFEGNPAILEELLTGLIAIAEADGPMHPAERNYLRTVARIFGFDASAFDRTRESLAESEAADPYKVLGVSPTAGADEIKRVWRNLARENHPDALTAKGMPKEFVEIAGRKLAHINAAYDRIRKERGLA